MPRAQACTVIPVTRAAPPPAPGERALNRMRRYTTASIVGVVALYGAMAMFQSPNWAITAALVASSVAAAVYAVFWERTAPLWLTVATFAVTGGTWVAAVVVGEAPGAVVLFAVSLITFTFTRPARHWGWLIAAAAVASVGPVGVAMIAAPSRDYSEWFALPIIATIGAVAVFGLNRYGFNLYLEIDAARATAAELAVVQERYRFAADLHDIQGHTLHVIRLKTQLADRLLDSNPSAAHEHLREAQQLIAETLADTKKLAFGDRHVAFASELANAQALVTAAGIDWSVEGTIPRFAHDELFGLVMREATTNLLRHAQATRVRVLLAPGRLEIVNDGSPLMPRSLSGLARLGERFVAIGGTLDTRSTNGEFATIASAT